MRPRRLVGLILQLSLAATWTAASGYACDMDDMHATHMTAMAMAAVPGMNMPDMPDMPGMNMSDMPQSPNSPPADETSCSFPWSGGDCGGTTSCTPAALSVPSPVLVAGAARQHEEPAWLAKQPRSLPRTPEPPPPRA